ncbi:MAG: 50S ribosomal protein L15 [Alphaproteobacteria bacterium]|nr:50S ribosomal protein L15 [Alphaproteobacteria bacterium]
MKLNQLKPKKGSKHNTKRLGRGIGSGKGKTSGRGGKGQTARSGTAIKGFEGGQMPLYQRLPKRGFNNIFAKDLVEITTGRLEQAIKYKMIDASKTIDADTLLQAKVIARKGDGVRLISKGTLKSKVTMKVAGVTKTAQAAVEKAGGKVDVVVFVPKPVVRKKPK